MRGEKLKLYNSITGEWVKPKQWQSELRIGDYYAIHHNRIVMGLQALPAPTVYGRITSSKNCDPGFFIVQAYSQWTPQGEMGNFCICDATHRLTKEQFKQIREAGWPELPEIFGKE
jgi:hypothetical protein